MKQSTYRFVLSTVLLVLAGEAAAIGLGELRGQPALGERPRFEIDILGAGAGSLDPGCFKLKQPAGDDNIPWLKQVNFSVRRGNPPVLEIRSNTPLSEPVLAVAVFVSCGHDIVREYLVFASPPTGRVADSAPLPRAPAAQSASTQRRQVAPTPRAAAASTPAQAPVASQPPEPSQTSVAPASSEPVEDKIKNMETAVNELQQRADNLTQRIEQTAAAAPAAPAGQVAPPESKPVASVPAPVAVPAETKTDGAQWSLTGILLGLLLLVVVWLGWRTYSQRRRNDAAFDAPDVMVDPQRKDEHEERGGVELQVDPVTMARPAKLDVSMIPTPPAKPDSISSSRLDSMMSVSAATVDEHFEANPVMELAEIMLSFGRVKGAAQALQEYVDANPKETIKPWIRLMDIYRMAGMRHEFERVARELNKNFNVEVQKWELPAEAGDAEVDLVLDAENMQPVRQATEVKIEGVEGMPAIMEQILMRWQGVGVIEYMNQLLRDNRGGTRIGFSLAVVSDILFLIDLMEIARASEGEPAT